MRMQAQTVTREAAALSSATAQFLLAYEQRRPARADEPPWLRRLRDDALGRFAAAGFPTTRQEDWKYTDVSPLHALLYEPAGSSAPDDAPVTLARIGRYLLADCDRFVVVDGRFDPLLSSVGDFPRGIRVRNLGDLWRAGGGPAAGDGLARELVEQHLGRVVGPEQPFAALNTALATDGALVHFERGVQQLRPLQLLYVSTAGPPRASYPRQLIVCDADSRAVVIETYLGLGGEPYLTNAVTEVVLGRGAVLDHVKLQLEGGGAFHVATVEARQQRRSDLRSLSLSFGGRLVRNEINTRLDDEGSSCSLDGLYLADGAQHVDHHTVIDHRQAGCSSRERYKGILDGRATTVFNGKVFVREGAVRTDARQSNHNLLLSDEATVNTKPQLEIFADDVRCTHGATVGQLDDEALFYLRARGLSAADARQALVAAFAGEIVGEVAHDGLRQHLEQRLAERLDALGLVATVGRA